MKSARFGRLRERVMVRRAMLVGDDASLPTAPENRSDQSSSGVVSGGRSDGPPAPRRIPWWWLAKFTFGLALLLYMLNYFDFHDVWQRIGSANRLGITLAFGLAILQSICFSLRWRYLALCTGANLPTGQAIIGNFELSFFSQFVPSAVAADVVRIIRAQRAGLTLTQSVTSIFLDRGVGLTTIVFLTPFLFLLAPGASSSEQLSWILWGLGFVFAVGLVATYFIGPVLQMLFGNRRIVRFFVAVSEAFRTLVHSLPIASFAVLASIVGYALIALALAAIASATSSPIGVSAALLAVCLMTLSTFIPVSIGGWGVREGAALLALGLFAVEPSDALAISILYGLVIAAVGVIGGIVWMFFGYTSRANLR